MTDGNTYAINKHLDEREDYDALQEVYADLEQAEAKIVELEAKLAKAMKVIDMIASAEHRDYRAVWIRGREFAKTGLGPKRRVYTPPDPEVISTQEWDAYMSSSFAATRVDESNIRDSYQSIWPATEHELDPPTTSEIAKAFRRQKNNE